MFQALSFPPTSCGPYTLTFWYRGIKGFRGFLVVYLANGLVNVPGSHSGWNPFILLPAWQFVHGVNVTDDQWHKATVTGLVPVDPANTQLLFQDVPAFLDVAIDEVQLVSTPLDAGEIGLGIDCEGQSGGTLTFSSTWIDLPPGIDPQTIEWDFGDGDRATGQTVTHTFADLGTYDVCATISNPCGCESTVCAPFTIDPSHCASAAVNPPEATKTWSVPNIFSPNGDGINDRFKPYAKGAGAVIHRLDIYDRWGGKFYGLAGSRPLEEEPGWDGTIGGVAVNPGVYTYVIQLTDAAGEYIRLSGDVTVLR